MADSVMPSHLWTEETPAPKTTDVLTQIAHFLDQLGDYPKTFKALIKEAKENGHQLDIAEWERGTDTGASAAFLDLWSLWYDERSSHPTLPGPVEESSEGSDSESDSESDSDSESSSDSDDSDDEAEDALIDAEAEETSDDGSDDEQAAPASTKGVAKRKRSDSSSSSSSSSSSDDSSEASESSDDDSSSDESDAPPAKKTKVASTESSDSDSDSDSSESSDDSSSESESEDAKSDSSDDDSSDDSDSSAAGSSTPTKAAPKGKKSTPVAKKQSQGTNSESSATLDASSAESSAQEDEMEVDNEVNHVHPSRQSRVPDAVTPKSQNGKGSAKKEVVPFSRIPADQYVDPRFASNEYVSYDYADRAHRDLIVTKGKGFTKEKNKKKRGSYRGGMIDLTPKGIKFDD